MTDEYDDDELFGDGNEEISDEEMSDTIYSIANMAGFCSATRMLAANDLNGNMDKGTKECKLTEEELDGFITLVQVEKIVRKHALPDDDNSGKICINLEIYENIFDDIATQMYGSALAKLAADGFLEQAWDDKLNDMVFWVKDINE